MRNHTFKFNILLVFCLCIPLVGYGQIGKKLDLVLKEKTIKDFFYTIESNTDFTFMYNDIDLEQKVTIDARQMPLADILNQVLTPKALFYEVKGKQILIKKSTITNAAKETARKTVSGTVTDNKGEPVIGANVVEKGTINGVITNVDGSYTIQTAANAVLQVSYIGYNTLEKRVTKEKVLDIVLQENTQALEEVVVVGYGVQKKVNLTGAVTAVSEADLISKPVSSTSQALAGLVPGLSVVQSSGRPGTGASINLRGTGTFSRAGTEPLVLIDGLSGSIDDVDPNNIQSISFLKDAASASIYGNRAANGVILIETKKGAAGKISISYNNSFGWQKPTVLPDFLPSWEYATYYNEAMANMNKPATYSDAEIQKYRDGSDPDNYPNVNHLEWLLNSGSGFQHRHTLSLQGGNEITNYNLSVGYWDQDGMTRKTAYERYSAILNMSSKLTNSLTLNIGANAYHSLYSAPNGDPQSIDGIIGYAVRQGPIYAGEKSDGTFGYQNNFSPEAWLAGESFVSDRYFNINTNAQLIWSTPVKGLSVIGRGGVKYSNSYNKSYRSENYFDENKTVGPASLYLSSGTTTHTTLEALANYVKEFGSHSLNVLAGTSREMYANRYLSGGRNTFPNNFLYELVSGDASTATNSSGLDECALVSFFGRANYAFSSRYLLEANIRYDASSRFSDQNKWGLFPSFSGGWRVSEEGFWKDSQMSKVVDHLKLRMSWGVLGNQNIGIYPYQQVYSLGENYPIGNPAKLLSGARMNAFNNPNITWETTSITDVGLDFALLKGKMNFVLDYFYKYTSDILAPVQRAAVMGRNVGESNVGAISNKGVEVTLSYNGNIGKNFRFNISPNFTYIRNAVEELADGAKEEINSGRIVGQPLGIIYGYETEGLFVDQTEIENAPTQLIDKGSLKPGYVRYKDISGPDGVPDGIVNSQYDRKVLGTETPKFYYGLNLSASFKGFDFSALLQGMGGHKRLIGSYMAYAFFNGGQIQSWQVENRFLPDQPDKGATYPLLEMTNLNDPNHQVSSYWIRNASYLRLKNVQIGYSLPEPVLAKIGIRKARVYVSGQNLYNFTSFYRGWDPENLIGTGDNPSFYPVNAVYSFGLNITL